MGNKMSLWQLLTKGHDINEIKIDVLKENISLLENKILRDSIRIEQLEHKVKSILQKLADYDAGKVEE